MRRRSGLDEVSGTLSLWAKRGGEVTAVPLTAPEVTAAPPDDALPLDVVMPVEESLPFGCIKCGQTMGRDTYWSNVVVCGICASCAAEAAGGVVAEYMVRKP